MPTRTLRHSKRLKRGLNTKQTGARTDLFAEPIEIVDQRRKVDYGKSFHTLRHPETWSCMQSGSTEDAVLILGTGQVCGLADSVVPGNGCRLALQLGERPFHILDLVTKEIVDINLESTGLLQKMRQRCAALQRTLLGSDTGEPSADGSLVAIKTKATPWQHLRRYVRLFSLPFFQASNLRRRRLQDLRAAADLEPIEPSASSGGDGTLRRVLETEQATVQRLLDRATEYQHLSSGRTKASSNHGTEGKGKGISRTGATPPGFTGCRNLGNSCYMNSTLHCLSSCVPLRRLLFGWRPPLVTSYEEYLGGMAQTGQPYGMFRAASVGLEAEAGPMVSYDAAEDSGPIRSTSGASNDSEFATTPRLQPLGLEAPRMLRLPSEVVRAYESGGGLLGGESPAAALVSKGCSGGSSSLLTDSDGQGEMQGSDLASVPLGSAFHLSLSRLWMPARLPVYTPQGLLSTVWRTLPKFAGFRQHDVDEFLRGVLERLDEEMQAAARRGRGRGRGSGKDSRVKGQGRKGDKHVKDKGSSSMSTAGDEDKDKDEDTDEDEACPTPIASMFQHETVRRVRCRACGNVSATRNSAIGPMLVDIPARFSGQPKSRSRSRAGVACTLRMCFEGMCQPTALEGDSQYECSSSKCKGKKQDADIWVSLGRLLPVLPLTIVRTEWTMMGRTKKQTHVEFPLNGLRLDDFNENGVIGKGPLGGSGGSAQQSQEDSDELTGYGSASSGSGARSASVPSPSYSLVALVQHHGKKPTSGHYTCIGRRDGLSAGRLPSGRKLQKARSASSGAGSATDDSSSHSCSDAWVDFNDMRVKVISPAAVLGTEASVLMYVRSDLLSRPKASALAGQLLHESGFVLPPTATVLLDNTGDGHADVAVTVAPVGASREFASSVDKNGALAKLFPMVEDDAAEEMDGEGSQHTSATAGAKRARSESDAGPDESTRSEESGLKQATGKKSRS